MRLVHVLIMLGMACAAITAFAITANGYQIYPPPAGHPSALPYGLDLYGKQLLGRWSGIFWPSALFATVGFFVNHNQATRYPGLIVGVAVALFLTYVSWGTKIGS